MTFGIELQSLINKYSKENESNTPDFILAEYIDGCLSAFNHAVTRRTKWYEPHPLATSTDGGGQRAPQRDIRK